VKLLGIISEDFDITDKLLIRFFTFDRYRRKKWNTMRQYISYSYTSRKPMVQLGGKYCTINILIEFEAPMKDMVKQVNSRVSNTKTHWQELMRILVLKSLCPFTDPERAHSISAGVANKGR
jgi:hypothetical protein